MGTSSKLKTTIRMSADSRPDSLCSSHPCMKNVNTDNQQSRNILVWRAEVERRNFYSCLLANRGTKGIHFFKTMPFEILICSQRSVIGQNRVFSANARSLYLTGPLLCWVWHNSCAMLRRQYLSCTGFCVSNHVEPQCHCYVHRALLLDLRSLTILHRRRCCI